MKKNGSSGVRCSVLYFIFLFLLRLPSFHSRLQGKRPSEPSKIP